MTSPVQPRILVSVATFNERDNLAPLVHEIRRYAARVPHSDHG